MTEINVRDARRNLKALLDRAVAGEEIVLLRRGRPVARLLPPETERRRLPSLAAFRASVYLGGRPLSREVAQARGEGRE